MCSDIRVGVLFARCSSCWSREPDNETRARERQHECIFVRRQGCYSNDVYAQLYTHFLVLSAANDDRIVLLTLSDTSILSIAAHRMTFADETPSLELSTRSLIGRPWKTIRESLVMFTLNRKSSPAVSRAGSVRNHSPLYALSSPV